jgi:hypothetical protein
VYESIDFGEKCQDIFFTHAAERSPGRLRIDGDGDYLQVAAADPEGDPGHVPGPGAKKETGKLKTVAQSALNLPGLQE